VTLGWFFPIHDFDLSSTHIVDACAKYMLLSLVDACVKYNVAVVSEFGHIEEFVL
jgi:hypothetical protein